MQGLLRAAEEATHSLYDAGLQTLIRAGPTLDGLCREIYLAYMTLPQELITGPLLIGLAPFIKVSWKLTHALGRLVFSNTMTIVARGQGYSRNRDRAQQVTMIQPIDRVVSRYIDPVIALISSTFLALGVSKTCHGLAVIKSSSPVNVWSSIFWATNYTARQVLSLRILAPIFYYPDLFLGLYPALWIGWQFYNQYKARKAGMQIVINNIINNNYGTPTGAQAAALATQQHSAIRQIVSFGGLGPILGYTYSRMEQLATVGLGPVVHEVYDDIRYCFAHPQSTFFSVFTFPLRSAIGLILGGDLAKYTLPGLRWKDGDSRIFSSLRVPEILCPDTIVPGSLRIYGETPGITRLPWREERPQYCRQLPMKPMTNNHFFLDWLGTTFPNQRDRLQDLTKVPPSPLKGAQEILKFDRKEITFPQPEHEFQQFIQKFLDHLFGLRATEMFDALRPIDVEMSMFSHKSLQSHPGLYTRGGLLVVNGEVKGFGTKADAFEPSKVYATEVYESVLSGSEEELQKHRWLCLPVLKKQAQRKEDHVSRCRLAVIPETYHAILWKGLLLNLIEHIEGMSPLRTCHSRWKVFNDSLKTIWAKFSQPGLKSAFDISDMGASIQIEIAEIFGLWITRHVRVEGRTNPRFWTTMIREIIQSIVGVFAEADGVMGIDFFKVASGIKDGQMWTSFFDALSAAIILGALIFRVAVRDGKDPLDLMARVTAEVHGDNCLWNTPRGLPDLSLASHFAEKVAADLGFAVKREECGVGLELPDLDLMSWRITPLKVRNQLLVVGWKETPSALKSLALPERILKDIPTAGQVKYNAEIVTALYILHYWNPLTRRILERYWNFLKSSRIDGIDEINITGEWWSRNSWWLTDDFFLDFTPVNLSSSEFPYPQEKVVSLWFGARPIQGWIQNSVTPLGPTPSEIAMEENLTREIFPYDAATFYTTYNHPIDEFFDKVERVDEPEFSPRPVNLGDRERFLFDPETSLREDRLRMQRAAKLRQYRSPPTAATYARWDLDNETRLEREQKRPDKGIIRDPDEPHERKIVRFRAIPINSVRLVPDSDVPSVRENEVFRSPDMPNELLQRKGQAIVSLTPEEFDIIATQTPELILQLIATTSMAITALVARFSDARCYGEPWWEGMLSLLPSITYRLPLLQPLLRFDALCKPLYDAIPGPLRSCFSIPWLLIAYVFPEYGIRCHTDPVSFLHEADPDRFVPEALFYGPVREEIVKTIDSYTHIPLCSFLNAFSESRVSSPSDFILRFFSHTEHQGQSLPYRVGQHILWNFAVAIRLGWFGAPAPLILMSYCWYWHKLTSYFKRTPLRPVLDRCERVPYVGRGLSAIVSVGALVICHFALENICLLAHTAGKLTPLKQAVQDAIVNAAFDA